MNSKFLGTMVLIFALVSGACYILSNKQPLFEFPVLMGGNALMLLLSVVAWFMTKKTLAERPQAFVRGVFSATLVKMFAVMIVVIAYALANKAHLYKPLVFAFFGIYVIYTSAETIILSNMAKRVQQ